MELEKRGKSNLQEGGREREREREREKDWVFFLTNLGDFGSSAWGNFEDWFLLGGLRIGLGFLEA